jgi:hypothetical protein
MTELVEMKEFYELTELIELTVAVELTENWIPAWTRMTTFA